MLYHFKIKNIRSILIIGFIIVLLLYVRYNVFNEFDIYNEEVYKQFSPKTLINESKTQSFENLIDKVIVVKGTLKEIHFKHNMYTLYINHANSELFVMCELEKDEFNKVKDLKIGNNIVIKGVLKGHLLDIILLHCVII